MRLEYRFTCTLRNGLHARPASMLAEVAGAFRAQVTIHKAGDDQPGVDVRSVLSIVGLDVKFGDECVLTALGDDADSVLAALQGLIEGRLSEGDEDPDEHNPANEAPAHGAALRLPVSLARLKPHALQGRGVCAGIAEGRIVTVATLTLTPEQLAAKPGPVDRELASVRLASAGLHDDLARRSLEASGLEKELLAAHASMATDPALLEEIERGIRGGATAPQAVIAAARGFCGRLSSAASAYIRDRALDVQDVTMQLLVRLGAGGGQANVALEEPSIVFAELLTPNQLLGMARSLLQGLVLGHVGVTSHTVIVARSLGLPTIVDASVRGVESGQSAIVDGTRGIAIVQPDRAVQRWYEKAHDASERRRARSLPLALRPAITSDGVRLEVGCNASGAADVAAAMASGAEGVGLLRTELLFLDRDTPPTEDEQFEAYSAVVRAASGKPVIIRTFDIGGDKPAKYMSIPREENPFLGLRGLRLYKKHFKILRAQLRAILRASALGPVKIMAPMVSLPNEAAQFRAQVEKVKATLRDEGVAFSESTPVGVMVEVPGIAVVMDQLCRHADFVSIGTNDLTQYTFAVDRGNDAVGPLYDSRHPGLLRLLRTIVEGARRAGRWVGVCGEMAGDPVNLPLMLGLGVDEISVAPGEVARIKQDVQAASAAKCRDLLQLACDCDDSAAVRSLLLTSHWKHEAPSPILSMELIALAADASTKEEAIRAAVNLLYINERTSDADAVEHAVWAREATYSTGLGYGFAVPHCKSDAVAAPTLAVLKLSAPVEWGSMDGQPVSIVILLTIPATDTAGTHMKVFAKVCRKLMHEEFRASVQGANTTAELHAFLRAELGLDALGGVGVTPIPPSH